MNKTRFDLAGGAVNRSTPFELRAIDEENYTVEFVVSPRSVDRHGTIFLPSGWRLDSYKANPSFLWCHRKTGDLKDVLGSAADVWVEEDVGLIARLQFAVDAHENAQIAWKLVKGGHLRAVSHSFGAYGVVYDDDLPSQIATLPDWAQASLDSKESGCWAVFTDQELREISLVPVGSNRDALKRELGEEIPWEAVERFLGPDDEELDMDKILAELSGLRGIVEATQADVAVLKERVPERAEPEVVPTIDEVRQMPAEEFLALLFGA